MIKIGNLSIEAILLQKKQPCLWRDERIQSMTLAKVTNERGSEGHILFCAETDKREVLEEILFTDNLDLFTDQAPEGHELASLQSLACPAPSEEAEQLLLATMAEEPVFENGAWRC